MISDYFGIRRCKLEVDDLYRRGGQYEYNHGFNPIAITALVIGIVPNIPGFLGALGVVEAGPVFTKLYEWGWFVAFFGAGLAYYGGTLLLDWRRHGSHPENQGQRHRVRKPVSARVGASGN